MSSRWRPSVLHWSSKNNKYIMNSQVIIQNKHRTRWISTNNKGMPMVANKAESGNSCSPRNAFEPITCSKTTIIPRTFYSSLCNYYTFSKPVWTNDWNTGFWFVLLLVITHFHQWLWRVKNLLDERERMEGWNGCLKVCTTRLIEGGFKVESVSPTGL